MTKRRKTEANNPVKIEVKEENTEYLTAKGRLKGVLKQLTETENSDSDSSDDNRGYRRRYEFYRSREQTMYRSTYVMKLFDRSVDLARFEEDTPLYPICRAWMANQPRSTSSIKRRLSSPNVDYYGFDFWNGHDEKEVLYLPRPTVQFKSRVPSPLPEQETKNISEITFDSEKKVPIPKEILVKQHLRRWVNVKKKWIATSQKNEERYKESIKILQNIYNKAQESME